PFHAQIRQMLAGYAETDKDFTSLRRVCRSLHEAIDQDNYSLWRRRFFEVFDAPLTRIDPKDNWKCKAGYQERQRW
ncbi:F-box-like domain-containing protein, partial [Klebsiella pneumoniae]|uniref:F-box-like domain-containing protein n=1 Tax=Klebsiella pneumoniae TaxID=573 RepID=UPI00272F2210